MDDEPEIRKVVRETLEQTGATVTYSNSLPYKAPKIFFKFFYRITLATLLRLTTADRQEITRIFSFIPGILNGLVIADLL